MNILLFKLQLSSKEVEGIS